METAGCESHAWMRSPGLIQGNSIHHVVRFVFPSFNGRLKRFGWLQSVVEMVGGTGERRSGSKSRGGAAFPL